MNIKNSKTRYFANNKDKCSMAKRIKLINKFTMVVCKYIKYFDTIQ